MARDLTDPMRTAIAADMLPIFLWAGYFDSGTLRLWTGFGDLLAMGEVWVGAGDLGGISPVTETIEIRADGVRFSLNHMDAAAIGIALDEPYQNRLCELFVGALTADGQVITAPVMVFAGRMDVMRSTEEAAGASLVLTAENELATLQRPRVRRYTPEDIKAEFPEETFFDYVAGLQRMEVILP